MRNEKRIDVILDKIREEWKKNPDYRFHQLLQNMGIESRMDNWYLPDEYILEKLELTEKEYVRQ